METEIVDVRELEKKILKKQTQVDKLNKEIEELARDINNEHKKQLKFKIDTE